MKLNRISALAALAVAVMIVVGQFVGGVQAAPAARPAASVQASLSAQVSPPATQAVSKGKAARPADQAPYLVTVQGRLTDASGNPITVATNVSFKLYTVPSGGTAVFTEGPISITPDGNGLFTYQLGSATSLSTIQSDFASPLYLGITVGSDSEMTPRFVLTTAPYAMSLAPGATTSGNLTGDAFMGINTSASSNFNSGLHGRGQIGVFGEGAIGVNGSATDNGDVATYGAYFYNGNNHSNQTGAYVSAGHGYGLFGQSAGGSPTQDSAGVVGISTVAGDSTHHVAGGVFSDTLTNGAGAVGYAGPYSSGNLPAGSGLAGFGRGLGGDGVLGQDPGQYGIGVIGDATNLPHGNGDPSAIGGWFNSYDTDAAHLGLQVSGQGHATGGFSTGLGYYMTVKYNGTDALHPGDVLALDGNNVTVDGVKTLGAVKASADNASAAIGVAQYRLQVYEGQTNTGFHHIEQPDTAATGIKPGDLVSVVIAGQAQVKVSGKVNIGDRLAIGSDGSISAAKADNANSIGKVASKPDQSGMVTVFVNLK